MLKRRVERVVDEVEDAREQVDRDGLCLEPEGEGGGATRSLAEAEATYRSNSRNKRPSHSYRQPPLVFCGSFYLKLTQKTYRVRLHVRVGNPARLTYVSSYVRTRVGNPARHQKTSVIELKDVLQGNVAIDWHRRQHSRSSYLTCAWHPRRIVSNCACLIIFLTKEVYGRAST